MAKPKGRALPRRARNYPQTHRIFSTNFMPQMHEQGRCYVVLEDFQKLEKKYLQLFKRYRRK